MRNTFYGILAVGLLLFLSSSIYANSTPDCKPFVHIQPVKGNYIPLLNGDIENLEKFLLELAEQNANYCNASLRIDFKEGLETKQTITHGAPRYNEKLFLEVQYFSPSYEAVIETEAGDLLHKIALGKELKSIEYSNAELNNHDALYTEWRRISKGNLSKVEMDGDNFQALIDFLKMENGMSIPAKPSLAINEKKEILSPKGDTAKAEKKERSTRKSRRKKAKEKSKGKESNELAKTKTPPTQKNSRSKIEKESKPKVRVEETVISESKPIEKVVEESERKSTKREVIPTPKVFNNQEKTPNKKELTSKVEKYLAPTTSTEVAKVKESQSQKSAKPREIISDDEMFENAGVLEPLAEMVRFQFPYGKNYTVINESDFSIKINTGRKSGKVFEDSSIKPKQEKKLKNKFKIGDWYSLVYPEKLQEKDVENYKKSIESILADLDLSDLEEEFFKMSEQLIPNLEIISSENPLADTSQKEKVEASFQKFIDEKGIEVFRENQQKEAATELKKLLTLIVQSHRLHHYYKYTVGDSAAKRPVNKLPRFRKN
jgi:hypothetical protein